MSFKNTRFFSRSCEEVPSSQYSTLAPNLDISSHDRVYLDALNEAIKNDQNKNIAITGIYGAGKSSIIEKFIQENKKDKSNKNKFLKISLATLQIDNDVDEVNDAKAREEEINKLEQCILKQIFFQVPIFKIPMTKFRIKSLIHKRQIWIYVGIVFFLCLFLLNVFYKTFYDKIQIFTVLNFILSFFLKNYLCRVLLELIGVILFIIVTYKFFIFIISNLCLEKLEINKVTIKKYNKEESFFYRYLEEILYFCQETKINIFIFEDIDRFNNAEIFIKLRELNYIINSNKLKRKIVFIYAIRDNIFSGEERTKFFDFILPVIPYATSNSSYNLLKNQINELCGKGHQLPTQYFENIGCLVSDMRMIRNIVNEFKIYKTLMSNTGLSDKNLLSIMIYKNKFPDDFCKLQNNEGVLYSYLKEDKDAIKKSKTSILEQQIECIDLLLKYGYISNDVHSYINYFHEGILSEHDSNIILDIKNNIDRGFECLIENPELVISRLDIEDFNRASCFNFILLKSLILSDRFEIKLKSFVKTLVNKENLKRKFISDFYQYCIKNSTLPIFMDLLKELTKIDDNVLSLIQTLSTINNENKLQIYLQIFLNVEIDKLVNLDKHNIVKDIFNQYQIEICNNIPINKFEKIITVLKIYFKNIDIRCKTEVIESILKLGMFDINKKNMNLINNIYFRNKYFFDKNLTIIMSSEYDWLKNKINESIEEYVLFIVDLKQQRDDPEYIKYLLEHKNLSIELKEKIIDIEEKQINNFSNIEPDLWQRLMKNNKVKPSWEIVEDYLSKTLDKEIIIDYINNYWPLLDFIPPNKRNLALKLLNDTDAYKIKKFLIFDYFEFNVNEIFNKNKKIFRKLISARLIKPTEENFASLINIAPQCTYWFVVTYHDKINFNIGKYSFLDQEYKKIIINKDISNSIKNNLIFSSKIPQNFEIQKLVINFIIANIDLKFIKIDEFINIVNQLNKSNAFCLLNHYFDEIPIKVILEYIINNCKTDFNKTSDYIIVRISHFESIEKFISKLAQSVELEVIKVTDESIDCKIYSNSFNKLDLHK